MGRSAAESRATSVPPSLTNCSRAEAPARPSPPVYSGGSLPGALPSRMDFSGASGRTMTSRLSRSEPRRTSASSSVR
ncbi:MAG: hypothetical protein DMF80_15685 [Acidobacteria bacterium]|nr:MAG: hypothetical protein DMF80_15685 [Acidobacteriota bacterium]